jgi:hypothetical protein
MPRLIERRLVRDAAPLFLSAPASVRLSQTNFFERKFDEISAVAMEKPHRAPAQRASEITNGVKASESFSFDVPKIPDSRFGLKNYFFSRCYFFHFSFVKL